MNEEKQKEFKKELLEKIQSDSVIIMFSDILKTKYYYPKLVGGAIVDILEGKKPKDYDFIGLNKKDILNNGFEFKFATKTAETYQKDDIIVQILTTSIESFDYKISQTAYAFHSKELEIDCHSFINKDLAPVCFEPKQALNSLRRLPHWKNKGYSINDNTYHSLLNSACKAYLDKRQINS